MFGVIFNAVPELFEKNHEIRADLTSAAVVRRLISTVVSAKIKLCPSLCRYCIS